MQEPELNISKNKAEVKKKTQDMHRERAKVFFKVQRSCNSKRSTEEFVEEKIIEGPMDVSTSFSS